MPIPPACPSAALDKLALTRRRGTNSSTFSEISLVLIVPCFKFLDELYGGMIESCVIRYYYATVSHELQHLNNAKTPKAPGSLTTCVLYHDQVHCCCNYTSQTAPHLPMLVFSKPSFGIIVHQQRNTSFGNCFRSLSLIEAEDLQRRLSFSGEARVEEEE
jgi:hypothetical protein